MLENEGVLHRPDRHSPVFFTEDVNRLGVWDIVPNSGEGGGVCGGVDWVDTLEALGATERPVVRDLDGGNTIIAQVGHAAGKVAISYVLPFEVIPIQRSSGGLGSKATYCSMYCENTTADEGAIALHTVVSPVMGSEHMGSGGVRQAVLLHGHGPGSNRLGEEHVESVRHSRIEASPGRHTTTHRQREDSVAAGAGRGRAHYRDRGPDALSNDGRVGGVTDRAHGQLDVE